MLPKIVVPEEFARALRACRRHFVFAALFSAFVNFLYVSPTIYMLQVYERVVPTRGGLTLFVLTLGIIIALAALSLLDWVRARLLIRASIRLDEELSSELLIRSLRQVEGRNGRQVMRDFDTLRQSLTGPAILAFFDAPWCPIYILVSILVHPLLGLLASCATATLLFLAWISERAGEKAGGEVNAAALQSYRLQEQAVAFAEPIRAMGMVEAVARSQQSQRQRMLALQSRLTLRNGHYLAVTKFARLLFQSLALGLGALLAIDNQISPGAIFAAAFLLGRALSPVEQMVGAWRQMAQAQAAWGSIREVLAEPAQLPRTKLPDPVGAVAVEGVGVIVQSRPLLVDVSFNIRAGQVVGIIGPSGAGKSTLARLLAGAIMPDRGRVRLDGADLRDWDAGLLGRHIGYVPQEASLLPGTIKQNICRFETEIAHDLDQVDKAVVAAAMAVGVHDMILRLPGGYDYRLGAGSFGLSSGQAQRIALARALYREPAVLILDEPNAFLDAEGEQGLIGAITTYKNAGHSVILVAHRLGVLPVVDMLLVLSEGRARIFGPRDEVIQHLNVGSKPRAVKTATETGD